MSAKGLIKEENCNEDCIMKVCHDFILLEHKFQKFHPLLQLFVHDSLLIVIPLLLPINEKLPHFFRFFWAYLLPVHHFENFLLSDPDALILVEIRLKLLLCDEKLFTRFWRKKYNGKLLKKSGILTLSLRSRVLRCPFRSHSWWHCIY